VLKNQINSELNDLYKTQATLSKGQLDDEISTIVNRIKRTSNRQVDAMSKTQHGAYGGLELKATDDQTLEKIVDYSMTMTNKELKHNPYNTEKVLSSSKRVRPQTAMEQMMGRQRSVEKKMRQTNSPPKLATSASQRRISPKSESKFTLIGSEGPLKLSTLEKHLHTKLGYEWKNIYRNLLQNDAEESGLVELREFDEVCLKFKVSFSKEELAKIRKQFGEEDEQEIVTLNN